jgi:hypothetical protein
MLVIASDIHCQTGGQFARPLENGLSTWAFVGFKFLDWFTVFCESLKPKLEAILIPGDLFSLKNNIPVPLFNRVYDSLTSLVEEAEVPVFIIPGNHDRFMQSTDEDTHSLYALGKGIKGLHVITNPNMLYSTQHYHIYGVPAGITIPEKFDDGFVGVKSKYIRIAMIHENVVGASFPSGGVVEEDKGVDPESLFRLMKREELDFVVCGDIHRGQIITPRQVMELPRSSMKLSRGRSIILPGSPYRQDFGDEGQSRGILLLDRDTVKFLPYQHGPKFITVTDKNFEKEMRQPKSGAYMRFRISKPSYRERIDKMMSKDQFFRDHFVCEYTYGVEEGEFTTTDVHDYRSLVGDYVISAVEKDEKAKRQVSGLIAIGLKYFDQAREKLNK